MQTHLDMCQQTFVCGCKGSELFWIEQIKMPFMRKFCINGRGSLAYNAILNMSGKVS